MEILINKILGLLGFRIIRNKTYHQYITLNYLDFRNSGKTFTPFDLKKIESKRPTQFVINISSRSLMHNPIFEVWKQVLDVYRDEDKEVKEQDRVSFGILKDYFRTFQPKNVAELLGLSTLPSENEDYFKSEALNGVYPWHIRTPDFYYQQKQEIMRQEFLDNGIKDYDYKKDGYKFFGPVSETLMLVEYQRITRLYDSIKTKGFLPDFGFPSANCFVKEGSYLLEVKDRFHSVGVMLALGYPEIPLIFSNNFGVIDRDKPKDWNHVQSGLFSEELAIELFEKVFKSYPISTIS